jgi:16S rRNA (adenine1518-N6/adenine1519-N6)-dimethyltransferase
MKHHQPTIDLLDQLKVSALKRYGQNFLIDSVVINQIMDLVSIQPGQVLLEIGPGLGALTGPLLQKKPNYISYEIDQTFHQFLEKNYPQGLHHRKNFLKATPVPVDWIIGNLPYYATTEILEKIYKDFSTLKNMTLMVQKEVFPRLIATPGDEAYGPLAIFLKTLGTVTLNITVSPEAFFPEPKVQSVVFSLKAHNSGPEVETRPFFYFIKKAFLHRRKTILNNILPLVSSKNEAEFMLNKVQIASNLRPEAIQVDDFVRLYRIIQAKKPL